jgi:hypothetical protein
VAGEHGSRIARFAPHRLLLQRLVNHRPLGLCNHLATFKRYPPKK